MILLKIFLLNNLFHQLLNLECALKVIITFVSKLVKNKHNINIMIRKYLIIKHVKKSKINKIKQLSK